MQGEQRESTARLSDMQRQWLTSLLKRYSEVFRESEGIPPFRDMTHSIILQPTSQVVSLRPYRYPQYQKDEIEKQVQKMLKQGIIRESTSALSSSVILVRKKDNSRRMCIDYQVLNKVTMSDKYPIPVVEELIDELHGGRYFSKLDLKSGYHQIRMRKIDVHKTEFRTHDGHYEFSYALLSHKCAGYISIGDESDVQTFSSKVCAGFFFMIFWFLVPIGIVT